MYPTEPAIAPDNLYPLQQTPPPYFTFPSWWRPFVFRTLSARQLSIYIYLCTLFSEVGTAYPLKTQIAQDLGIRNRAVIDDALEALVAKGFLLSERRTIARSGGDVQRTVYQRPAIEFTLLRLLDIGLIDGFLQMQDDREQEALHRRHRTAIKMGLSKMTGLRETVIRYDEVSDSQKKTKALRQLLERSFENKRSEA